ncbi:Gpr1 family protein [Ephemerocybe angulata]|uniref:Gpr1 family protein n=1 Tax=Ephemerocybe angulata TaxID=980116 RepID=A0A8H6M2I5_9AGAR|nr:Gpr1 family protein [Tulosesus angulatus]
MSPKPNGNSLDSKIEYAGALPNQDAVAAPAGPPLPLTSTFGNPTPAGMFAFAGTMLLMALYNLGAGGVHVSNVLVGMLVFAGGIAQFMVAMWEIARGNTLFATCFLSFSTFWLSYAAVLIPSFGVMEAYKDAPEELPKALGLYLFVWFITIFLHLPAVIGKSHMFTVLLSFASLAVLMLSCGMYTQIKTLSIVGNSLLLVVCSLAYYIGLAGLLASDPGSAFTLPLF